MFVNQFTGVTRGFITTPNEASSTRNFRKLIPELVGAHGPPDFTGFFFISIKKSRPHQAFEVAEKLNFLPISKIMVVVDEDVNIHDPMEMIAKCGCSLAATPWWEKILEEGPGFFLDPSAKTRGRSSKIIIDATRQWPEKSGPDPYPKLNRELLLDHTPDIFEVIKEKWGHLL
ncbi:MAG: hypothetical protein Ct9H300mP4_17630 [Gammaproteobacteria bacterium]|nr:MAG: hypothetical protein Ct9H300mP4_17630 [Gammaproteobacteria bacterium]